MIGQLADVLKSLLTTSLPGLLGGAAPAVQASVVPDLFTIDPQSVEADAGEPRVDDQTDTLPFNAANPGGPYTLTKPPMPGPKRVRLATPAGDRIALQDSEVVWDRVNGKAFTLQLRHDRDLSGVNGVEVLYGVVAVFVKIKALQKLALQLQSANPAQLGQARDLAIAVVELNRKQIVEQAGASFQDGDYSAVVAVRSLKLLSGTAPAANTCLLQFTAEVEVKGTRALAADEGAPIVRIASPGRAPDPKRPVDVEIGVDG